jgi:hypothetical protein
MPFHKQGREFPVFVRETRQDGAVKFGVVIGADGGYVETSRILAVKGSRVVFALQYNYISALNAGHRVGTGQNRLDPKPCQTSSVKQ